MSETNLSDTKKMLQYEANKKSVGIAYLFWFLFGIFGAHRFYLGLEGSGTILLLLTIFSFILLLFQGFGLILMFAVGVWLLIDLAIIPSLVNEYNNRLIEKLG